MNLVQLKNKNLNEGLIRDCGYHSGSIVYLKDVKIKNIIGNELDAEWKKDTKEIWR